LPVVGSVPGYLAGGVLGGAGGTVAYGATCWWS
ncbi:bacteriocin, partial [Faecalibacterium prausnitzii]